MENTLFNEASDAYDKEDYEVAFAIFLKLAESGNLSSMANIAVMYNTGRGVDLDVEKSIKWDEKAIQAGNTASMSNLGITYRMCGDIRKAKFWFEKAIAAGDDETALELAKMYLVSDLEKERVKHYLEMVLTAKHCTEAGRDEARDLLDQLSKSSIAKNQRRFNKASATYDKGDYVAAFDIFLDLAESGDVGSMSQIAIMYGAAQGVDLDFDKSIEWDEKAIQAGSITSMTNLGITHRMRGNVKKAKFWLEKALAAGDSEAALELAKMYLISDLETERAKQYLEMVLAGESCTDAGRDEARELLRQLSGHS